MDKLLVFFMLMPFSLMLLFQPSLDRVEEAREKVIQVAIQRGVERAAIDGYFTDENLEEMKGLLTAVGYKEEDIQFKGTLVPAQRGEYVEGALKVPNQYQFLLFENLVTGEIEEKYHYHSASRMSEYLN